MARWKEPTEHNIRGYTEWIATRPEAVQAVARRFDPWTLYRMKSTGQRVCVIGFDEMEAGGVCVRVEVSGDFNFVTHERQVYGIDPDDLVECDLPTAAEITGSLDMTPDELMPLMRARQREN